jgi:glycosyltransferase involved in cell wall biosynthesis
MPDGDLTDLAESRDGSADVRRLRVAHLTRRPVREHGGVERVVRGLAAAMAEGDQAWEVSVHSAFRSAGALEGLTGLNDVIAAVRLARWLLRNDVDVAFVHCPECLWLVRPSRVLSRLRRGAGRRRTAVVAVWHGAGPKPALVLRPPGSRLAAALARFRSTEERGALGSDGHVAVHGLVERELREYYGLSAPIVVIENALDPEAFERYASAPEPRGESRFTALWVGQADHRKGLDVALEAVELARRRVPELRLTIAGVPARGGFEGVDWLGVVPPDEIAQAYRRADVLLFPTRYEAHPLVVLEAMAAGLPVVVSDAVPSDMVADGRNGFVIAGHRPPDYAAALLRLHDDAAYRGEMGRRNRQDVQRFNQATAARRYADVALGLVARDR